MTRLMIDDPELASALRAARTKVEICDATGLPLGHFLPVVRTDAAEEPAPEVRRTGQANDDDFWNSVGIE